jgi:hypothetical protein
VLISFLLLFSLFEDKKSQSFKVQSEVHSYSLLFFSVLFFYPFCRNLQATLISLYSTKLEQCSQPLVNSLRKHLHTLFWIREYVKYKIYWKNTILFIKYHEVFKKWSILFFTSKLLINIALISLIISHLNKW